jgi:hypothetical protein
VRSCSSLCLVIRFSCAGSEHLIGDTAYPMEMHLVHYKATHSSIKEALGEGAYDSLAVLGIFFEVRHSLVEDNIINYTLICVTSLPRQECNINTCMICNGTVFILISVHKYARAMMCFRQYHNNSKPKLAML